MPFVIGIGGATCSGKTTLCSKLIELWKSRLKIHIINQDDYFLPKEQVERIPHLDHYNYETLQSLDSDRLVQDVKISTQGDAAVLIVEGNIIFAHPEIVEVCDLRYFMTLTREECWNIRKNRVYDPPDVPGFFEEYVWPCYLEHFVDVQKLTKQYSVEFLAGLQLDNNVQAINKAMRSRLLKNWVEIMNTKLSVDEAIEFVTLPECGAISTFIGTTRNSFDGKEVVHLEYEAYSPMALKELELLCGTLRSKWPSIAKIAILHRIGTVPVTEASVVIAVSCPHRAEAIAAVESAIDNIKAHVPIWKLEVYKDSATWKANKECSWLHQDRPPISRE